MVSHVRRFCFEVNQSSGNYSRMRTFAETFSVDHFRVLLGVALEEGKNYSPERAWKYMQVLTQRNSAINMKELCAGVRETVVAELERRVDPVEQT